MKPKRFFFHQTQLFGSPLRCGVPLALGFMVCFTGLDASAGDILRGGSRNNGGNKTRASNLGGAPPPSATDSARANARDMLARTDRTLAAMRAMQNAARNAANKGPNNLGKNPLKPTVKLPNVPNGLVAGGLKVSGNITTDPTKWTGAKLPTQTVKNGKTKVTIKQTEQQALLEWETFNIGKNTTLTFDQKKGGENVGQWIAFNKVNDPSANPTQILGNIKAKGQVYIINPNGIIFGGSSQVNARGLTASSLPINTNLIERGLLNNPDAQFLFSGLDMPSGSNGTPSFTAEKPLDSSGKYGDVTVEKGAVLKSPSNSAKVGGRIMLVGPNVSNKGTIEAPDGQAILAAGMQVGVVAHSSSDPSLRGLDVFVGAVTDTTAGAYAGTATQSGLIRSDRGNITITGKEVNQLGVLESSTSVALNGRVDLQAFYDATTLTDAGTTRFVLRQAGITTLGEDSQIRIMPEYESKETKEGVELALRSAINVSGSTIHIGADSTVLAPNAITNFSAGTWNLSQREPAFTQSGGQIYFGTNAIINVAGSMGVEVPVEQNIITVELRGAELAGSPLQRVGNLRNKTVRVDIRDEGIYKQEMWKGTPLADISGFANLIQKGVGQLTVAGGTVNISAGESVVMNKGAKIDVSGGFISYQGGNVSTTQLISGGRLVDISLAKPDEVYDGIFDGTNTYFLKKWNVTNTYTHSLAPAGFRFERASTSGGAGGSLSISAASMALDGKLVGKTFNGEKQRTQPVASSSVKLSFTAQDTKFQNNPIYSPYKPQVIFQKPPEQKPVAPFTLDSQSNPASLDEERRSMVYISPELMGSSGFGAVTIENQDGDIFIPENVSLTAARGSSLTLKANNITVDGAISIEGGNLSFSTYNITLDQINLIRSTTNATSPTANVGRGIFTLGVNGRIDVSGSVLDDRKSSGSSFVTPYLTQGGSIKVEGYSADLKAGGVLDVSGGVHVAPTGTVSYGQGGALSISTGNDLNFKATTGGSLSLGSSLRGYSGTKGGSLSLTAGAFHIGGGNAAKGATTISNNFFSEGGFNSFTLTGLGLATGKPDSHIPGVLVSDSAEIRPVVTNLIVDPRNSGLRFRNIIREEGVRSPVNITLAALGVSDEFGNQILVRGDVLMAEGALISTDAKANITLKGQTATVLGTIRTPGGTINVSGSNKSVSNDPNPANALTTVVIGGSARLSAAGATVLTTSPLGLRQGEVLKGGSITISGNIAAERGAVLDVSGTSGVLDLDPEFGSILGDASDGFSGATHVPVKIDSDGGSIVLRGGQFIYNDATLTGKAGGRSAIGGFITVSSNRFIPAQTAFSSADENLIVTQGRFILPQTQDSLAVGGIVLGNDGKVLKGLGMFDVDRLENGGFHSLALSGNVRFEGKVNVRTRGSLSVATGGVLFANDLVKLESNHVSLGQQFLTPPTAGAQPPVFTFTNSAGQSSNDPHHVLPTGGDGRLIVDAKLIDIGNLTLQGISSARFIANQGDVRGNGTLSATGELVFKAGQIYPTTAGAFSVFVYDDTSATKPIAGSIKVLQAGDRPLPYSAGGVLSLYASNINVDGTLRAPIGTINLGWDGSGIAPFDTITGNLLKAPVATDVIVSKDGLISVSAIDPANPDKRVVLPYGISLDGNSWIDPYGNDITISGLPAKAVNLSAANIDTRSGSVIDIRGGGDLYAYRWITGNGGRKDVLASNNSFAIIKDYDFDYAPYAPFNDSTQATLLGGATGYTNSTLKVGDKIRIGGGRDLAAGVYTLLPARYALFPGAVLITPDSTTPVGGSVNRPEGTTLVSGYRFNSLDTSRSGRTLISRFEIAGSKVVRARSEYQDLYANTVLKQAALVREFAVPRLPVDAGYLSFSSTTSMSIEGGVDSKTSKSGRGSVIDISSPGDILINKTGTGGKNGELVLKTSLLNQFEAESLLIGGFRRTDDGIIKVDVTSDKLTVDNSGSNLKGKDLILVANDSLSLEKGSKITSVENQADLDDLVFGSDDLTGSGNGTLVRVSGADTGKSSRFGVSASGAELRVRGGVTLDGTCVVLDSTSATRFNTNVNLDAAKLRLGSGQISILLNNPGSLNATNGLILTGDFLATLRKTTQNLALSSYSSIDVYGTGQVGSTDLKDLSLSSAAIRGFHTGNGEASFVARNLTIRGVPSGTSVAAAGQSNGKLRFKGNTITLGADQVSVSGFKQTELIAENGILFTGTGGFSSAGDLDLKTPVITGENIAKYSISSAASLDLNRMAGSSPADLISGGFGAELLIAAGTVRVDSDINLASGKLTLNAVSGDMTIGGRNSAMIDLGGTVSRLVDANRYTHGGTINLNSELGSVTIANKAVLQLSAKPGGGDAGALRIAAAKGEFNLEGKIEGSEGTGGTAGRFSLDVGSITNGSLSALDSTLNAGGFVGTRDYRIRTGDVKVNGPATSHGYRVVADAGDITVSNKIDASGNTGGVIDLKASGSLILAGNAELDASAKIFSSAGKGGSVTLEAGSAINGIIDPSAALNMAAGSTIKLGVASNNNDSASQGRFTGTLHLRAPRTTDNSAIRIDGINSDITGASSILIEGFEQYDVTDLGGTITNQIRGLIQTRGQNFINALEADANSAVSLFISGHPGLKSKIVLAPGAEIINTASRTPLDFSLNAANSSVSIPNGGGVFFPNGTPGNSLVRTNVAANITAPDGTVTALAANTPVALQPGSTITLRSNGNVVYASGNGGGIAVKLNPGFSYTTSSTNAVATVNTRGSMVTLNTANSSAVELVAGTIVTLPNGTVGTNRVRANVAGKYITPDGVETAFAANTNLNIPAGSRLLLNVAGTLTYATGTGGAVPVALASGSFKTRGATAVTPATGDVVLGSLTSTSADDWNLETYRFGSKQSPGVLTIRAASDVRLFNSLSDGFAAVTPDASNGQSSLWLAQLMAQNPELPVNTQSWSYRITAGADFSSADFSSVLSEEQLGNGIGSVLLGKNYGNARFVSGTNATTAAAIANRYQMIRTGSGDISINAAADTFLLNQFATIYTAGTRVADPTTLFKPNDFSLPVLYPIFPQVSGPLGTLQQDYPAQYSMAGGNLTIKVGSDIARMTRDVTTATGGNLISDSSRQLPNNWLSRRGYLDKDTGRFGQGGVNAGANSLSDPSASTTWWVDFSNFFQGLGTLGGGDIVLDAGGNIRNIDAAAPTNARAASGTPRASALLELGGGDIKVTAANNIDGGVYYIERGSGRLVAGKSLTTNSTRSPSIGLVTSLTDPIIRDERTWLPTTLFLGKGSFDVQAGGDLLLGPVSNTFLLPQGMTNRFWYKTYFNTYDEDSSVDVVSLGGNVSHRTEAILPGESSAKPMLEAWLGSQNVLNEGNASFYQPWLRLSETSLSPFSTLAGLMAPTLRSTSISGNISFQGDLTLFPSTKGQIELIARGSLNGFNPLGISEVFSNDGTFATIWSSGTINLSDADPASIPNALSPFAYQSIVGLGATQLRVTGSGFLDFIDQKFAETGSINSVLQTKQALHAQSLLHLNDTQPVRLFALDGDISGLTLFSPKSTKVIAGNDISDVTLYIQNVSAQDASIVSAGRDLNPYNANTALRTLANSAGNVPGNNQGPLAGDIQISGPGTLQVLAGRDIDLGTGSGNLDGTGSGITSIGALRNPALSAEGADLFVGAGIGFAESLSNSNLDFAAFIKSFGTSPAGNRYLAESVGILGVSGSSFKNKSGTGGSSKERFRIDSLVKGGPAEKAGLKPGDVLLKVSDTDIPAGYDDSYLLSGIEIGKRTNITVLRDGKRVNLNITPGSNRLDLSDTALTGEMRKELAMSLFYLALRDAGRDFNNPDMPTYQKYTMGKKAVKTLFPKETQWLGEILTRSRDIRTRSGGDISIFAPGGGLTMSNSTIGNPLTPPGIVTESGGKISVFTHQSVDIGIGRIFTLKGGDVAIWSSKGDIAAGSSSRTVSAAPPTRVIVDPQSAEVATDLAGLATGGGIGVLATVKGVAPGDVDLIAPSGVIDAGDAGIRVSGNINLAAVSVVNAGNISAGGTSTGAPAVAVSGPAISAVTSASNAATAASATTSEKPVDNQQAKQQDQQDSGVASIFTVDVIGYGGGGAEDEEEEENSESSETQPTP
jgi:filamentous hemagglutinin